VSDPTVSEHDAERDEAAERRFRIEPGAEQADGAAEEAVARRSAESIQEAAAAKADEPEAAEPIFDVRDVNVFYGEHKAIRNVTMALRQREITALIGPSGCGKSTFIRCLNRMNDLIPTARVEGEVIYHGQDLYASNIDPVQVRKRIGMVFQKPNPFPKSIYDNIAFGPRVMGMKGNMDEIVERALTRAALWDETKDRLKTNAFGMSGGQQQRLCIARALATEPDVLLMDEPCSALDPISTGRIEDLMMELKENYSIVIVTHNMQQAARVSDMTAFFTVELDEEARHRTGAVVEFAATDKIFTTPDDKRTEDYVTGKFG
jgi:phosphate transport system ATP-binding protein